ncbi:hypothetical protein DFJ73DRAFT_512447 [Zopfochytrium polystomum]|nr:hypothetical protein DFJ73DRAFT_512447 [Zopfochytrium polystomum]
MVVLFVCPRFRSTCVGMGNRCGRRMRSAEQDQYAAKISANAILLGAPGNHQSHRSLQDQTRLLFHAPAPAQGLPAGPGPGGSGAVSVPPGALPGLPPGPPPISPPLPPSPPSGSPARPPEPPMGLPAGLPAALPAGAPAAPPAAPAGPPGGLPAGAPAGPPAIPAGLPGGLPADASSPVLQNLPLQGPDPAGQPSTRGQPQPGGLPNPGANPPESPGPMPQPGGPSAAGPGIPALPAGASGLPPTGGAHDGALPAQRCGKGWPDADGKCGTPCPSGLDKECPAGETCFASLNTAPCAGAGAGGGAVGAGGQATGQNPASGPPQPQAGPAGAAAPPANCANVHDGGIACTSSVSFNVCSGGQPLWHTDAICGMGTICCQALGRCEFVGCSGTPTGPIMAVGGHRQSKVVDDRVSSYPPRPAQNAQVRQRPSNGRDVDAGSQGTAPRAKGFDSRQPISGADAARAQQGSTADRESTSQAPASADRQRGFDLSVFLADDELDAARAPPRGKESSLNVLPETPRPPPARPHAQSARPKGHAASPNVWVSSDHTKSLACKQGYKTEWDPDQGTMVCRPVRRRRGFTG